MAATCFSVKSIPATSEHGPGVLTEAQAPGYVTHSTWMLQLLGGEVPQTQWRVNLVGTGLP